MQNYAVKEIIIQERTENPTFMNSLTQVQSSIHLNVTVPSRTDLIQKIILYFFSSEEAVLFYLNL